MFSPDGQLFRMKRGTTVAEAFCRRVRSEDLLLTEGELRDLLRAHPELVQQALSVGDMWDGEEWHYAGSEVGVRSIGKVDLLFIDDTGRPILIETKLFRNPEARRQVVTQVSEYAFHLAAARATTLLSNRERAPELDDLIQDIDDHLRRGVLTLVIVGDVIDDRAIRLAEALLGTSRPEQMSLAFVELAFFADARASDPSTWVIAPYLRKGLVAQVREVFEFRIMDGNRELSGSIRPVGPAVPTPYSMTEDALLSSISTAQGAAGRRAAEALLALARSMGAEIAFRQAGASIRLRDPQGSSARITLYVLSSKGTFYVWWLKRWDQIGADPAVAAAYLERLEAILGRRVAYRPTEDRNAVPLGVVVQRLDDLIKLVRDTVQSLRGTV